MTRDKITEITVTDERGEAHTLRCSNGLEITVGEGITAVTKPPLNTLSKPPLNTLSLHVAPGRWIAYRLTYGS